MSPGHKLARAPIAKGAAILKFGQIIGYATEDIPEGGHVHTQNCDFGGHDSDYKIGADLAAAPAPRSRRSRRAISWAIAARARSAPAT